MDWDIRVGQALARTEVHSRYGGQEQSGISTPTNSPNILIFTDPVKGRRYGYDRHEGLRPDETYAYTGEGRIGPQSFVRGNKAIRDSQGSGKVLRLFRTKGTQATYIGSFTLADPAYEFRDIPDERGDIRRGIIFSLAPLEADTTALPTYGGESLSSHQILNWTPPSVSDFEVQLTEEALSPRIASRIEFELQADFGLWLQAKGHTVKTLRLVVGASIIEPDLYDESSSQIFEAKKSSGRGYVRMAIGQVLDYAFCARRSGINAKPAIVLPGEPDRDLEHLCSQLGINLYVRDGDGFREMR